MKERAKRDAFIVESVTMLSCVGVGGLELHREVQLSI